MISKEALRLIDEILKKYHSAITIKYAGSESVSPEDVSKLLAEGIIKPQDIEGSVVSDAWLMGKLREILPEKELEKLSPAEFKSRYRGIISTLTDEEKKKLGVLRDQAAASMVAMSDSARNTMKTSLLNLTFEHMTEYLGEPVKNILEENYIQNKGLGKLVSALKKQAGDFSSKWDRTATTEMTKIINASMADTIVARNKDKTNDEIHCFFHVVHDAKLCPRCHSLYLNSDGTPKIFTMSELIANGSNYGKKQTDWNPNLQTMHPRCFGESVRLSTNEGLLTVKELFELQKELVVSVDSRIKKPTNKSRSGNIYIERHNKGMISKPASKVFYTGILPCLEIELYSGHTIQISREHEVWVDDKTVGKKIRAENLKVDDLLLLQSGKGLFGKDHFPELAELMGNCLGDGSLANGTAWFTWFGDDIEYGQKLYKSIKKIIGYQPGQVEELKISPPGLKYNVPSMATNSRLLAKKFTEKGLFNKKPRFVPDKIWSSDEETICAFLRGLYSADGCFEASEKKRSGSVRLTQNDLDFLKQIQLLLFNLGITASIYTQDKGYCQKTITYANGDTYVTNRKPTWRLISNGCENVHLFCNLIGFGQKSKSLNLSKVPQSSNKGRWRTSRIKSIRDIGETPTYCLTEPETNTVTANGIVVGQCRCTLAYVPEGFGFKENSDSLTWKGVGFKEFDKQRKGVVFDEYDKRRKK